ncbi:lipocalin family protein [uncultured Algibacter sp.]|uniref:lipocalin family protein n=1 Tax=uncultured Algibacter sp. TaxID=298659 RepID=UPI00262AADBA|nr:lipocalin family protein [uncultured Algibacter sp.]
MRKLILLFSILTLVLTSCSSDDSSSSQDLIVGTWTYYKAFTNGIEEVLSDCEKQETFVFSSNGVIDYTYYEEDGLGNCLLEESISGSWINEGNNVYTLTFAGESSSETLTFENNTFYYEETSGTDVYKEVYIKN